jgi:ribulose-phosphate 3-epimerase
VRAYVSLWSADLLALGEAVALVESEADGFHLDVFDGHNVRDLLFGPDVVAALRARTDALLDVHLNVEEPDYWARRFADAGADMVTVQTAPCADVRATMRAIAALGVRPGLGLEVTDSPSIAIELLEEVDRVLVMGTAIGVKGLGLDERACGRVRELRAARDRSARRPEIVVDGGIRRQTVPDLAAAGADGVVPGSLVFGEPDPVAAIRWIHGLGLDVAAPAAVES